MAITIPQQPTRLLLIRHGLHDHRGRYFQHACPGLTEDGVTQAKALGARLACDPTLASVVVLASKAARTIQTAEIIADMLGVQVVEQTCELCEVHPGAMEGLTDEEVRQRYGGDYGAIPGRETFEAWYPRAHTGLRRITAEYCGHEILAVTHNGVINASFGVFGGMPVSPQTQVRAANTSITEWSSIGDVKDKLWRLERHNDTAHLMVSQESPT